jgi:hypothetical protein
MSVDGTDFQIQEPKPFSKKWYGHKFKAAGLRYEVGVSIHNSSIAWIKGPFPCGRWPDSKIFDFFLSNKLLPNEKVVADKGYRFNPECTTPSDDLSPNMRVRMKRISGRHEHVNKRFKQFSVLRKIFRHPIIKHKHCFYAIAVITQLHLVDDEPLMDSF